MIDPVEFFLNKKNKRIAKAVATDRFKAMENMPALLESMEANLRLWVKDYLLENGYEPHEVELKTDTFDYGRNISLGIFFTGEKEDDLRGFLLNTYRAATSLKEENERLKETLLEERREKKDLFENVKNYFELKEYHFDIKGV